jgi:CheY-like chemotaxis protein
MIVDDDEAVSDVLHDYVVELGHDPLLVRSAEAALARLNRDHPDVILLDIHLPGMSGLDFLALTPVRAARIPIVAISGVVTESQARECLRLGALDFVGKPITLERLAAVLDFLEPQALERQGVRAGVAARQAPRAPRAKLAMSVRITGYGGGEWTGESVNLSAVGMKVATGTKLEVRTAVRLAFSLPDGRGPLEVTALVVRNDRDGDAFYFVNVRPVDSERLAAVVKRLSD